MTRRLPFGNSSLHRERCVRGYEVPAIARIAAEEGSP